MTRRHPHNAWLMAQMMSLVGELGGASWKYAHDDAVVFIEFDDLRTVKVPYRVLDEKDAPALHALVRGGVAGDSGGPTGKIEERVDDVLIEWQHETGAPVEMLSVEKARAEVKRRGALVSRICDHARGVTLGWRTENDVNGPNRGYGRGGLGQYFR